MGGSASGTGSGAGSGTQSGGAASSQGGGTTSGGATSGGSSAPGLLNKDPVAKGQKSKFTLTLGTLLANPAITDTYYQDPANIAQVVFHYVSTAGGQYTYVNFPSPAEGATSATLVESEFQVSPKARDEFQLNKIVLQDYDGGEFVLHRESLTQFASQTDVELTRRFNITRPSSGTITVHQGGGGGADSIIFQTIEAGTGTVSVPIPSEHLSTAFVRYTEDGTELLTNWSTGGGGTGSNLGSGDLPVSSLSSGATLTAVLEPNLPPVTLTFSIPDHGQLESTAGDIVGTGDGEVMSESFPPGTMLDIWWYTDDAYVPGPLLLNGVAVPGVYKKAAGSRVSVPEHWEYQFPMPVGGGTLEMGATAEKPVITLTSSIGGQLVIGTSETQAGMDGVVTRVPIGNHLADVVVQWSPGTRTLDTFSVTSGGQTLAVTPTVVNGVATMTIAAPITADFTITATLVPASEVIFGWSNQGGDTVSITNGTTIWNNPADNDALAVAVGDTLTITYTPNPASPPGTDPVQTPSLVMWEITAPPPYTEYGELEVIPMTETTPGTWTVTRTLVAGDIGHVIGLEYR